MHEWRDSLLVRHWLTEQCAVDVMGSNPAKTSFLSILGSLLCTNIVETNLASDGMIKLNCLTMINHT